MSWKWTGFTNYQYIFHDPVFLESIWNVFRIWIYGGIIIFVFAFFLATIITSGIKGKSFWRALIYLPNTVSAVVLSVVWLQYVYNPQFGLFVTLFSKLGLKSLAQIQWASDSMMFTSMLIAYCFGSIGYFMLILLAGIERIPGDLYEAAYLEGINPLQKFFKITLPLLRDVFKMSLVLWTITAMNFFVWSATFGLDSPKTMTPAYFMYEYIFGQSTGNTYTANSINIGAGASIAVLITFAVLIVTAIINTLFKKSSVEY